MIMIEPICDRDDLSLPTLSQTAHIEGLTRLYQEDLERRALAAVPKQSLGDVPERKAYAFKRRKSLHG